MDLDIGSSLANFFDFTKVLPISNPNSLIHGWLVATVLRGFDVLILYSNSIGYLSGDILGL